MVVLLILFDIVMKMLLNFQTNEVVVEDHDFLDSDYVIIIYVDI